MNKNKINITNELRGFLGLLYMFDWKYIARDEDGKLYIYKDCPIKGERYWLPFIEIKMTYLDYLSDEIKMIHLDYLSDLINVNKVFEFIKWKDEEPFYIEDYID